MASSKPSKVFVEPHQRHITGQSDLETALHTLLDHLSEPFSALKGNTEEFRHVFNNSFHVGAHKPKNSNGGYARIFAPKIDLRETANVYLIDMELPGVPDVSCLTILWRSDRELLVSGAIERPATPELISQSHKGAEHPPRHGDNRDYHDIESGVLQGSTAKSWRSEAPVYVGADEANGFDKDSDHFPLDIVDGQQLDEGDRHRVNVRTYHNHNTKVGSGVLIGERDLGKFMRCFVFPHRVNTKGLRTELENGLLRLGVPKAAAWDEGRDASLNMDWKNGALGSEGKLRSVRDEP